MDDNNREIQEAIAAADNALRHLRIARDCLNSAANWGLFDMFGGGSISGFVKHSKMRHAANEITNARSAMMKLSKELKDIGDVSFLMSNFLTFADLFYDGFVVDIIAQSRIAKGRNMCNEAISNVTKIKKELQKRLL